MTDGINRITPGPSQPPAVRVNSAQGDEPDQPFHDFAKSEQSVEEYKENRANANQVIKSRRVGQNRVVVASSSYTRNKSGLFGPDEDYRVVYDAARGETHYLRWIVDA